MTDVEKNYIVLLLESILSDLLVFREDFFDDNYNFENRFFQSILLQIQSLIDEVINNEI